MDGSITNLIFLAVFLAVGLLAYVIYLVKRDYGNTQRIEVHVDPKDAADNYIEGGDHQDGAAVARAIEPTQKRELQISAKYIPENPVTVRAHSRYMYERKAHLMTKAERAFYVRLETIFPEDCYIFPQVHMDDLIQGAHQYSGDNWKAWAHIRLKSVDYVVCDSNFHIRLAIELDDWSHDLEKRQKRDIEVEQAFHSAGLPLLRCRNVIKISDIELKKLVLDAFRNCDPELVPTY